MNKVKFTTLLRRVTQVTASARQQGVRREAKMRRKCGVWTEFKSSLHSTVWPWCAQEEFKVWKRSGIRKKAAERRWLDCKRRRSQPVGSALQPSDNIFSAAAPSGLWCREGVVFYFSVLSTNIPIIRARRNSILYMRDTLKLLEQSSFYFSRLYLLKMWYLYFPNWSSMADGSIEDAVAASCCLQSLASCRDSAPSEFCISSHNHCWLTLH